MKTAPVNKIIPFSNVDGPGNRTAIFFQGCNFNCLFCHNPETLRLCNHCGACLAACPTGALSRQGEKVVWQEALCCKCDACLTACPRCASPKVRQMHLEQLMAQIRRTAPYISGITCSGGECTLQMEFLIRLFTEVRALGLSCLLDSNGSFDFAGDSRVLALCDGVMLDVKAVEPGWSRQLTGCGPEPVLKNLDLLLEAGKLQEVRSLIFPGRDRENAETVSHVARRIGDRCLYKLICYRPFGVRQEYRALLGEASTDADYARRFEALAHSLGATHTRVI